MPQKNETAPLTRDRLVSLLDEQGLTVYQISQQIGCLPSAIKAMCKRYNRHIPDPWIEDWAKTSAARAILRELYGRFPDVKQKARQEIAGFLLGNCAKEEQNAPEWALSPLQDPEKAVTVSRKHLRKTSSPPEDYFLLTFAETWRRFHPAN